MKTMPHTASSVTPVIAIHGGENRFNLGRGLVITKDAVTVAVDGSAP